MNTLYKNVPNIGVFIIFVISEDNLFGDLVRTLISIGLIIKISPNNSSLLLHAANTKEADSPVATTVVVSPITFLIKSVINCAYKKFVYNICGLSELPHPRRSIQYTVYSVDNLSRKIYLL